MFNYGQLINDIAAYFVTIVACLSKTICYYLHLNCAMTNNLLYDIFIFEEIK